MSTQKSQSFLSHLLEVVNDLRLLVSGLKELLIEVKELVYILAILIFVILGIISFLQHYHH